jgi:hypothetical protein
VLGAWFEAIINTSYFEEGRNSKSLLIVVLSVSITEPLVAIANEYRNIAKLVFTMFLVSKTLKGGFQSISILKSQLN